MKDTISSHPVIAEHESDVGIKVAMVVADNLGSWRFIIIQTIIVAFWLTLNSAGFFIWHWDAYPFILLNLAFSTQAAYAAPLLQLSSNSAYKRDRSLWEHHFKLTQEDKAKTDEVLQKVQELHNLLVNGQTQTQTALNNSNEPSKK